MISLKFVDSQVDFECSIFNKTPLDYLLIAATLCVGHEIKEVYNTFERIPFKSVIVFFGEGRIKIRCQTDEEYREEFELIVKKCYILQNVKFKTELEFAEIRAQEHLIQELLLKPYFLAGSFLLAGA